MMMMMMMQSRVTTYIGLHSIRQYVLS